MYIRRPAGIVASTSSSSGIRSPAYVGDFHDPTSSVRSSSAVWSLMTIFAAPPAVRLVSASWLRISFPSLVRWTSSSAAGTPRSHASLYAASVFSGASCDSPRWATSSTRGLGPAGFGSAAATTAAAKTKAAGAATHIRVSRVERMTQFLAGRGRVVTAAPGSGWVGEA
jgi:hypothetical protein